MYRDNAPRVINFSKERDIRDIMQFLRNDADQFYVFALKKRIEQRFHPIQRQDSLRFVDVPLKTYGGKYAHG